MKNLLLVLAILAFANCSFSAGEYFRSIASGSWNSTSTWQMSTNNGSTWIAATLTPTEISGPISVQSPNTVTVTANVNADQLTVYNGAAISVNSLVALTIFDGPVEDFNLNSGAVISGAGKLQTQGSAIILHIHGGSSFNIALRVISGITTPYDAFSPYIVNFYGPVTVEPSAVLNTSLGGYTNCFYGPVQNYGTFSTGSGSAMRIGGPSLLNNGNVSGTNIFYDSATTISGTGTFTTRVIIVNYTGKLTLGSNITLSPSTSMTVYFGGIINPNSFTLNFNAGSFIMNNGAYALNSGVVQTQGTITLILRSTCFFNSPLKVNTGTLTCYDNLTNNAAINGNVTVDPGAILTVPAGAYTFTANGNLTNNGTISGTSVFKFNGGLFSNDGSVNVSTFNTETGAHSVKGLGTWNTPLNILNGSNFSLADHFQLRDININSGGSLTLNSYKLILTGNNPLNILGTVNATGGAIEYKGTSAQNINSGGINFYKLIINNSNGVSLQSDIAVNDTIDVSSGDLNLNGKIITLSSTGYLKESTGNTVYGTSGYITTTRNINAPSLLNVGGLGAVISTPVNLGSTQIKRGHTIQTSLQGGSGIKRYYDISPTVNSGLNASLVFKYDDSELNGIMESALALYRSTDTGINWTVSGGTPDTVLNTISLNSIDAFSRWSAAGSSSVASAIKIFPEAFLNIASNRLIARDTIRMYLRNIASPFTIIDSAKSVIDSLTFEGSFLFQNAPSGIYYLSATHRNSIETWSRGGGESYTKGVQFNYDFTSDSSKAYGNNMRKVNSVWGMISGDVDNTASVGLTDILEVYNQASMFASGYIVSDVTGDGTVTLDDVLYTYNNSVLFSQKVTP